MILVRNLVLRLLTYNILFQARHIPGVHNTGADYISRFQVEQFKKLSPRADELPTPVPTHLLPENWSLHWRVTQTLPESLGSFYSFPQQFFRSVDFALPIAIPLLALFLLLSLLHKLQRYITYE